MACTYVPFILNHNYALLISNTELANMHGTCIKATTVVTHVHGGGKELWYE